MSTISNVVLPKEKKVRTKKVTKDADVPAVPVEAPVQSDSEEKKVRTKKVTKDADVPAVPVPVEAPVQSDSEEKKPRKPTLSAKYSKFIVFGYSMINALVAAGLISDEQVDEGYAQIKLMDSVEDQTAFYSNFLENLSASGKAMKKFVNDKKKPPKVVKAKTKKVKAESESESEPKEKKPRAKKVKAEPEPEPEPVSEPEVKVKKPRAKKSVTVESDANVDLISNLVNAAQADPIPAPVEVQAEAPKKEAKTKKEAKKAKKEAKKEEPAPVPVAPVLEAEEEEDDDDEVIQTRETVIDGETFLVDQDGNLYDAESHEFIRKL